jgi:A/G-specific adenine glycosylase
LPEGIRLSGILMTPDQTLDFRGDLLNWFHAHQRILPWRQTEDPYHIWVSEVMLQQTQVKKVLEYYEGFLERFPDIQHLAGADLGEVLKAWERLGYYGRARNLHKAARVIVEKMGGEVPSRYDRFLELPGVGRYIAAAVQSLAFGKAIPVVDGNVKRVISRLFLIDRPLNTASILKEIEGKACNLLDSEQPGAFNQAMMELGATICRPGRPGCSQCPVRRCCRAFGANRQDRIPVVKKRKPIPEYHIAVGVVYRNNHMLITRRRPSGLLGGLWEFPGGKVREGETAEAACIREIREEVNLSVKIIDFLTRIRHAYTHFRILMDVFRCRYRSGEVLLKGPTAYRWITVEEIDRFPFPGVVVGSGTGRAPSSRDHRHRKPRGHDKKKRTTPWNPD